MPEKQLSDYTAWQWATVLLLSFWGSGAAYANQLLKNGLAFRAGEFVAKSVLAMFAGVLVFLICEAANVPELVRGAMVGMAGFLGSETMAMLRFWYRRRLGIAGADTIPGSPADD